MTRKFETRAKYSVATAGKASDAVESARMANRSWAERRRNIRKATGTKVESWKRETRTLPRDEARDFARKFLRKYPKAAYWSEVENWRVLEGDMIEFTMRRLPSAD